MPSREPIDPDGRDEEQHSLIEIPGGDKASISNDLELQSLNVSSENTRAHPWICRWASFVVVLFLSVVYSLGMESKTTGEDANPLDLEDKVTVAHGNNEVAAMTVDPNPTENDDKLHEQKEPKTVATGSFTRERLEATRKAGEDLLSMLEDYYFGHEQAVKMLLESWVEPWVFNPPENSTYAQERVDKLVDTMARALVTDDQKVFLMGAIGSSVVAGHDNCHYDSYESQMERVFGPVWEAAGMTFVFQNAGEGGGCGDTFKNQIFCVKQNISPDVDIVHYEWTYFEHGRADVDHESLVRWTQLLPRQPPVHIFNTGYLKQSALSTNLTNHYAKYGFNAFFMKTGFVNGGHEYDAEANREENPINRFGWGTVGDGYHETTRYGETSDDPARKESLGVVMRNWHPGPMGFQLTSDAFVYVYTKAILQALHLIEEVLDHGNDPRDRWSAAKRSRLRKQDLPPPVVCDPQYCVVDEAPSCLNFEKPTFGESGALVEDPKSNLNPHKDEVQNWDVWHEDNKLWHMVGKQDKVVFQGRDDKEMCRHLDACGGISASSVDNGMVVFRLPKMEVGMVILCGCCGKNVAESMFLNNTNIEIRYNNALLDRDAWDIYPNGKCVRLLKHFLPQGRRSTNSEESLFLSIKVLNDMSSQVKISHVITM